MADAVIEAQTVLRRGVWLRIRQAAPEELAQLDALAFQLEPSVLEPGRLDHLIGEEIDLGCLRLEEGQHRAQPFGDRSQGFVFDHR